MWPIIAELPALSHRRIDRKIRAGLVREAERLGFVAVDPDFRAYATPGEWQVVLGFVEANGFSIGDRVTVEVPMDGSQLRLR